MVTSANRIYTLSLHDALPICGAVSLTSAAFSAFLSAFRNSFRSLKRVSGSALSRSEEHTSELQSRGHLVCRLLLEKKNKYLEQLSNGMLRYNSCRDN